MIDTSGSGTAASKANKRCLSKILTLEYYCANTDRVSCRYSGPLSGFACRYYLPISSRFLFCFPPPLLVVPRSTLVCCLLRCRGVWFKGQNINNWLWFTPSRTSYKHDVENLRFRVRAIAHRDKMCTVSIICAACGK